MRKNTTKAVKVGNVIIGGGYPVAVQTMWDTSLEMNNQENTLQRIFKLHSMGCDLIRFSVPDINQLEMFQAVAEKSIIPVIADIHFDYKLAIGSIKAGAAKIRINPGNIGADWKVKEILACAEDYNIPIRIGVNGGSLPHAVRKNKNTCETMLQVIGDYINLCESVNFTQLVISLKDSSPLTTYEVNKRFSELYSYPLHLGVTEAGPLIPSVIKSTYALGKLLEEGIGDTLRISITGSLEDEVYAGVELLKVTGLKGDGVTLISCPKCGRSGFDTHVFVEKIQYAIQEIQVPITIAVMGCAVNGPGEAAHADIGITGIGNEVFIFRKGSIICRIPKEKAEETFMRELQSIINEKTHN